MTGYLKPQNGAGFKVKLLHMAWRQRNKRKDAAGASIRQWAADGFIELTEGNVTDYAFIKARISSVELAQAVQGLCFNYVLNET